ncbi:GLPGLI family protein [Chryseobacterium sp. CT-SW4]|uniref:GLPGLI family protein n=1 Tax=Chryseobacterium sp. SW-1 TaxID=3157343 RepID=UPI003B0159D1
MKKIGIIALMLVMQNMFAQTNRFVYQVTMKLDSTNRNDIKTENAYLDISPEKSLFYAENRIKRDSVMSKAVQSGGGPKSVRSQMESLKSNINYTVEKDKKALTTAYKDRLGRDTYLYEEDRPLNWKILSETTTIGEYKVQKAETDFAGRKWTAWFTTDLPYQDGPYKFSGLPGLIVKVEDSKGDYSFDLMKNYKIAELPNITQRGPGNIIKVKRKDYVKQQEKFRKDPVSFMTQGAPQPPRRGGDGGPGGPGGGANQAEMRKRMEERLKEETKTNNNPIELQ